MINLGNVKHIKVIQGTDDWIQARAGMLTASNAGKIITRSTLKFADNDTSRGHAAELAAERITGYVEPGRITADMERGIYDEPWARDIYSEHYAPVTTAGLLVRSHNGIKVGYSPDGLIGDDGIIEIKSRLPKHHLETILSGQVPAANIAQIQCGLYVTGRQWCDYISFSGGMRMYLIRVQRDDDWITSFQEAATQFETRITKIIRDYEQNTRGLPDTERLTYYEKDIDI